MAVASDDGSVAKWAEIIRATADYGEEQMQATMALPEPGRVDNETLALAVERVLAGDFAIKIPPAQLMHLRLGQSVRFVEVPPEGAARPGRRVNVLLAPEERVLEVAGVGPEDGADGWTEVFFTWRRLPGMVDERGNIDLKRLNTFPHVHAGDRLAMLHPARPGHPGVDARGRRLRQRPGVPVRLKWDQATVEARPVGEEGVTAFHARRGGIVEFRLERRDDPRTLVQLAVSETITIRGNVDYRVGDQGSTANKELSCASNIEVFGDVLGVFSLQSEGVIRVHGVAEGRLLQAQVVEAETVTAATTVKGQQSVVVGNAIRALLEAPEVVIRHTANECTIQSDGILRLEPGCALLGVRAHCRQVTGGAVRFSGRNRIVLGEQLFVQADELRRRLAAAATAVERQQPEVEEAARTAAEQLAGVARILGKVLQPLPPPVARLLAAVQQRFTAAVAGGEGGDGDAELFRRLCQGLVSELGEREVHESVLRKVLVLQRALERLAPLLAARAESTGGVAELERAREELRQRVAGLEVHLEKAELVGPSAEIQIQCGGATLAIRPENLPSGSFTVAYRPPPATEHDGRLVLEEEERF